jgi:biopolymer transport protein ExbD
MSTRGSSSQNTQEGSEIDLTPMLDVVFIMLIFFIVTAVFIKEPGVNVARPQTIERDQIKNQNILIAINPKNEVWIDRKLVEDTAIKSVIEAMLADNPLGAVVIQADGKSNAEAYALVYDAAKQAGVVDVALATDQK